MEDHEGRSHHELLDRGEFRRAAADNGVRVRDATWVSCARGHLNVTTGLRPGGWGYKKTGRASLPGLTRPASIPCVTRP